MLTNSHKKFELHYIDYSNSEQFDETYKLLKNKEARSLFIETNRTVLHLWLIIRMIIIISFFVSFFVGRAAKLDKKSNSEILGSHNPNAH